MKETGILLFVLLLIDRYFPVDASSTLGPEKILSPKIISNVIHVGVSSSTDSSFWRDNVYASNKTLETPSQPIITQENQKINNYNWHVLSLGLFSITGAFGNILVCMTIRRDPALQTKTNYYLFSLAIADLAVCLLVIPFSIIQDFSDEWMFSPFLCTFWIFSDILLCTSSIYHLSAVAILRFIAIQYPLKSNRTISTNQTFLILATIWIISTLFSTIILYLGNYNPKYVMDSDTGRCVLKHDKFIIYGSIFSFAIPLLIMIVMFCLMVRKLRMQLRKLDKASPCIHISGSGSIQQQQHQGLLRKSPSEGMKDSLSLNDHKGNKKNLLVVYKSQSDHDRNGSLLVGSSFKSPRKYSSPRSSARHFTWKKRTGSGTSASSNGAVAMPLASRRRTFRTSRSGTFRSAFNSSISSNNSTRIMCVMNDELDQNRLPHLLVPLQSEQQQQQQNQQNNLLPSRKPSCYDSSSLRRSTPVSSRNSYAKNSFLGHLSRLKVQSEVKALRVLGIVFIAFIVAWLPFCLLNIISAILGIYEINSNQINNALIYLTYLGYFQSTFNPIIYTVFNQKFRRNFIEILKCELKKSQGFQRKM